MTLAESLESLASLLEVSKKKTLKRTILVAAFLSFDAKTGKPLHPANIIEGDRLYIQALNETAAGTVSLNPLGRPFARALEDLAAGRTREIKVEVYEKQWVLDEDLNNCEVCADNELAGWIPTDEEFPNAGEPPLHPRCGCQIIYRRAD